MTNTSVDEILTEKAEKTKLENKTDRDQFGAVVTAAQGPEK